MLNLGANPAADREQGPDERKMEEQKQARWGTWIAETGDREQWLADVAGEATGWKEGEGVEEGGRETQRT